MYLNLFTCIYIKVRPVNNTYLECSIARHNVHLELSCSLHVVHPYYFNLNLLMFNSES